MRRLLEAIGSPQEGLRTIHVAGTKGKGSTVAFLENILMQSGYKVGAYTSPSVRSLGEMFRVGGREAAEQDLDRLLIGLKERVEATEGLRPTYFEVMTAMAYVVMRIVSGCLGLIQLRDMEAGNMHSPMAVWCTLCRFQHFRNEGVDVAIVEAGLGAARDATNALDATALDLGVVTSIGSEHVEALGGSLESIARAKAAVFKEGKVGVIAEQGEGVAEAVVLMEASERRVKTYRVEAVVGYHVEDERACLKETPGGVIIKNVVSFQVPGELVDACFGGPETSAAGGLDAWEFDASLSLVGRHQASNAATAIASSLALRSDAGYDRISRASIQTGLEMASLPGRFQVVDDVHLDGMDEIGAGIGAQTDHIPGISEPEEARKRVLTIVDGAHTKASARCVAETLRQLFPDSKLAVVMAMAADKDHEGFCSEIQKAQPNVVVFTETPIAGGQARSAGPGALAGAWRVAKMKNRSVDRTWRCRELIQANVRSALAKARHELSGEASAKDAPGIILVCGSLSIFKSCMRKDVT